MDFQDKICLLHTLLQKINTPCCIQTRGLSLACFSAASDEYKLSMAKIIKNVFSYPIGTNRRNNILCQNETNKAFLLTKVGFENSQGINI